MINDDPGPLRKALELVDIRFVDHLIVAGGVGRSRRDGHHGFELP
jgi:hypothetical protein